MAQTIYPETCRIEMIRIACRSHHLGLAPGDSSGEDRGGGLQGKTEAAGERRDMAEAGRRGELVRKGSAVLALGLIALGLSGLTAKAQASIVVGESVAGVHLGDSEGYVLKKLGKPFRSEPTFLVFQKPCLCSLDFKHQRVSGIDVLGKGQRTSKGVGVGTFYEKTVAAYPEAKCYHPPVYGETSRYCVLKSKYKGRAVKTIFAFYEQDLGVRDIEIRWP